MTENLPTSVGTPLKQSGGFKAKLGSFFTLRAWDVQLYRLCDDLSGALILPMIVFGPWAFGTTEHWSTWVMNVCGYMLGLLLLAKLFIRKIKKYPAFRWETFSLRTGTLSRRRYPGSRRLTGTLVGLMFAVLAFCLVSALNPAANFDVATRLFQYQTHVAWLPSSLDGHRTWFYFWMYLGLALSFWAVGDWLSGMTSGEERTVFTGAKNDSEKMAPLLTARLRWLLWTLCINGALLGVESIIQRASGSSKLLFLAQPLVNPDGLSQFGPYAYRSNAAQYFNLVWPLGLGFWWTLQRAGGLRVGAHHWLLLCVSIMVACPIISASRGGALVAVGVLILALIYMAATGFLKFIERSNGGSSRWSTVGVLILFLAVTVSLGWYFGWDSLAPRLGQMSEGYQDREEIYESAQPMATDYPLFGTGPGTFATVFALYRFSDSTYWPEQLHNDWLETRITFGWLGFSLLLLALACVGLRWFIPGGKRGSRRFVVLAWLGLVGCLIHALFDFPFQIHSTLFLFLVICAILFTQSRSSGGSRR